MLHAQPTSSSLISSLVQYLVKAVADNTLHIALTPQKKPLIHGTAKVTAQNPQEMKLTTVIITRTLLL